MQSGNNAVTEAVTIGNLELVQYLLGGTCPEGEINRVNTVRTLFSLLTTHACMLYTIHTFGRWSQAGITLLMWAASSNKMDIFDFLVQKGANLSAINEVS